MLGGWDFIYIYISSTSSKHIQKNKRKIYIIRGFGGSTDLCVYIYIYIYTYIYVYIYNEIYSQYHRGTVYHHKLTTMQ